MPDIKTKESTKSPIRTLDKTIKNIQRIKQDSNRVKEMADNIIDNESSAQEYAANSAEQGIQTISRESLYKADNIGRYSYRKTKNNINSAKEKFKTRKELKSLGKQKDAIKTPDRSIKTSNRKIKTNNQQIKGSEQVVKQSAKRLTEKTRIVVERTKEVASRIISYLKMAIESAKSFVLAIIASGWLSTMIIIVITLIALLCGSGFGVFFSGEDSGTGMTMRDAVIEINEEYQARLDEEKESIEYDVLEMSGSKALWKEVLAVYSVKVNTDDSNPQEVATMNDEKKELLKDIFWQMNEISSNTEIKTETITVEKDDGKGNIITEEQEVTQTYLYIDISHKTVDDMIAQYNFDNRKQKLLSELLDDKNNSLWSSVLYGITTSSEQIVNVALSQVGNVGGQPYWSWYGFNSRVEWCACFVSWCANECGYIDVGVIPKFAGVVLGIDWFKTRGQWADNSIEPSPGSIIFFDWQQDGLSDHVGIVEKCENGIIYTVEGNSIGDSCRQKTYSIGSSFIYGYGLPAY